ncbi:hypothetical protein DOTSEDRAFT_73029 [Dothistroma septosporum NZE10]|uniref:Heterokaryon incompatibility domain-containing protein n=1 Tax=Dothistroma septosporum (strain NZE10 / CBS 128990) TaxID=675120 RepID=N1PJ35_DOTSN|nr:hypothetical protein DOTSEDRAFT_73029 [Dothistroma septosporum NZE10]
MFRWYRSSKCCLAYLADVGSLSDGEDVVMEAFRKSVWFTRAWTLQELLAPTTVLFVNREWEIIGHKGRIRKGMGNLVRSTNDLTDQIAEITGIRRPVLLDFSMSKNIPFEEKQGWVMHRQTTRQEDKAYCLLGIFNISMPLIYGEGRKSFKRFLREVEEKERDTARKKQKKQKKMERKIRAQMDEAQEAERAPLTPILESPLVEVKGPRPIDRAIPLPSIPIPGPCTPYELVTTKTQRFSAIASALRHLWIAANSREQAIFAVASILDERGYAVPGDTIHEALSDMELVSSLAQVAYSGMVAAGWAPEDAVRHIESVCEQEGHPPEMAAAIAQEYMIYDAAVVDRGGFPYIPPSESFVSEESSLELKARRATVERHENDPSEQTLRDLQIEREDCVVKPASCTGLLPSLNLQKIAQSNEIQGAHHEADIEELDVDTTVLDAPRLSGQGITRTSETTSKDQGFVLMDTIPFDHFAAMHLFS